jgi:hypothetical protein
MIHNEIRAYLHELEVLADAVREHLELPSEYHADRRALQQLQTRLDHVQRAKLDLARAAASTP